MKLPGNVKCEACGDKKLHVVGMQERRREGNVIYMERWTGLCEKCWDASKRTEEV